MHTPASQRGISLLEVLLATAIFGIGALGLAGWMALAARAGHTAYLQTQAIYLADEMVERMHANRRGVWLGAYDGEVRGGTSTNHCGVAACTPAVLAAHDRAVWGTRLRSLLPDGGGAIHCEHDADAVLTTEQLAARPPFGGLCTMTLRWLERGAGDKDRPATGMRSQAWVFQP